MGSLGDDNGKIKPSQMNPKSDSPLAGTQPCDFDSQFSLPAVSGDKVDNEDNDGLQYLRSTAPFDDDNVPVEDAFETQVVNFCGETQVLNFGGETQVLDDVDCFENMETQLLDEFDDEVALDNDGEGTDVTEVLDDGDEDSNDDLSRGDCGRFLGQEEKKESLEQCNASIDEQRSSGIHVSTPDVEAVPESKPGSVRRFTSVRAASLRASGLAARNAALRGMNSESCSIRTDSQFSDQCTGNSDGLNPKVEKINQAHDQGNHDENSIGLRNGVNCSVGCSTARKLFAEKEGPFCSGENADAKEDLLQCDGSLAGLSYIDSQEPGELSQANALNFVERFVNDNVMELDDEVDLGKSTSGKSKLISSAKGLQSLAKKTIERRTAGETRIFDWDDFMEDEGGGDIYCRKKEEFYGNESRAQKSSTHPQKPKGRKLDESCNEDRPNSHDKKIVYSDSKLLLCKSNENDKKVCEGSMKFRKNLFNESGEQFNSDFSRGQLETTASKTGAPELVNVGFDTQMAAEAMEALFYGDGATDQNANLGAESISKGSSKGSLRGKSRKRVSSREPTMGKGVRCSGAGPVTRRSKKAKSRKECLLLQEKHSKNVRKECDTELLLPEMKKAKPNTDEHQIAGGIDMFKTPSKSIKQRKAGGALERSQYNGTRRSTRGSSIKERHPEKVHTFTPIAYRTRQSLVINVQMAETPASDWGKGRKHQKEVDFLQENRTGSTDINLSAVSNAKGQLSELSSNQSGECENAKSSNNDQLHLELIARSSNHALSHPQQRRSSRKMCVDVGESDNLKAQPKRSVLQEDRGQSIAVLKRSRSNNRRTHIHSTTRRITRSSVNTCPVLCFADQNAEGKLSHQSSDKEGSEDDVINYNSTEMNGRMVSTGVTGPEPAKSAKHSDGNRDAISSPIAESVAVNVTLDKSPKEKSKSPGSKCTTPVNCPTPINAASPVCMGEEYYKQSCKKNLSKSSLSKELRSLSHIEPEPISPLKDMRKRRDLANVRVLFSNHLDEDVIKQQKKILARLGISEASSILDATHFITDKFVRTRNMLEAIASGKPVVTYLWLESIGQVNIHIDEEAYILRDIRKEKELGFCMPVSLAHARKRPLLQGRRVFITPNTKPGKETISHLVTAVGGQAVERIGRSATKDDKVPDDLLVLSCEEDYATCVPFLEKGAAVYSSELLLNGIVTQKLDYERHRLFGDHVKRTRSTIWLRKDDKFLPVTKHK
ncbi:uncharacterized protein LOC110421980 isoform X1 [Herrania umbratica]|uniref:Uncharacterized protein LOC110421980 isoform X1 n=1 Tax=Herrania umbratica TaxID=108875 RepID=A0A6J1AWT2_9ROSI|nr:uncharacterized protein LOC110421980 isoform X1 [Herrania umbratica]